MIDPRDVDRRTHRHAAAMEPPCDALTEERAASMADEGGRSAAWVEAQEEHTSCISRPACRLGVLVGAFGLLGGLFVLFRFARSS